MAMINPVALSEPLSPHMAARLAGQRLTPASVRQVVCRCLASLCRHRDLVIVEGIGGLLVPIADRWRFGDLMAEMQRKNALASCRMHSLLVAADRLGTINHTLLTLEAARHRGLEICAVILNRSQPPDYASRTNAEALRRAADLPILGPVPRLRSASDEEMADALEACGVARCLGWQRRAPQR
ncbi:MAG: dethiobiotin synthase [Planctomycetota bacterium]|nr:dethiobiotin synthase [Planctomycetota bacterium]